MKRRPGSLRAAPALAAAVAAAIAMSVLLAAGPAGAQIEDRWYKPVVENGRTFPVLLPYDYRWLSWRDTYGAPRMRLVDGVWRQTGTHQGIDIFAERGAPVVSIAAGTVEKVGWTFYSGNRVGVRGVDGRYYFYAHLVDIAPGVTEGAPVSPGTVLGGMGSTGYGPPGTAEEFPAHLHFGLQSAAGWENPQAMLEDLYETARRQAVALRAQKQDLEKRKRLLQGRLFGPQAPAPDAAAEALADLDGQLSELVRGTLY